MNRLENARAILLRMALVVGLLFVFGVLTQAPSSDAAALPLSDWWLVVHDQCEDSLHWINSEGEFAASLVELESLCRVAEAIGVTRTTTWIPSWHDSLDFEENHAFHVDRLSRAARILGAHGIRFGLEFLGPKTLRTGHPYAFVHTSEAMLALCGDIDRAAGTRIRTLRLVTDQER